MESLLALFVAISQNLELPEGLLQSLCYVESKHNPKALHHDDGGTDSLGICQIKETTAKELGFNGSREELMKPDVNIYYAGKYLNKQLKRYRRDPKKAISAYNAGTFTSRNIGYTTKVVKQWEAYGQGR